MFGHQNNDQDSAKNEANPALPGSFPAIPQSTEGQDAPFNPALPPASSSWNNDQDTPSAPTFTAPVSNDGSDSKSDDTPSSGTAPSTANSDLLDIKQQALSQLSPLVSHLEQTPEEKFRTTMMMIQATDNQDLVKDAYAAAQTITDEKAKAQALLDIVNEINYFTQHHTSI